MLNTKTDTRKIAFIMLVIMAAASVVSFGTKAFAQDAAEAEVETVEAAVNNTGMDRIIPGTENWNGRYDIAPGSFFKNIWHTTGIYKMIHTATAEEIAAEKAKIEEEETLKKAGNDVFAATAPGWQYLLMIAIGFLIVYLGAGRGFEPLLLIPIGFGTILVNIPGAGMGNAPDGMLSIIYNAVVGNEFFPMLIFMGIGAMTDFGPLIANPKMALLGGAAQLGVFFTLFGVSLITIFFRLLPLLLLVVQMVRPQFTSQQNLLLSLWL